MNQEDLEKAVALFNGTPEKKILLNFSTTKLEIPLRINMSEDEYRELPGIRSSWLKLIRRSPGHLLHELSNPSDPTPAMKMGTLVHHAVLLGTEGLKVLIIDNDLSLRTKEGQVLKERAEAEGLTLVRNNDYTAIETMREMLLGDPYIKQLFHNSATEVPIVGAVDHGGIKVGCKARIDLLPDADAIVDLKCVASAEVDMFARACFRYGWHVQAKHYLSTFGAFLASDAPKDHVPEHLLQPRTKYLLIAIESEPPHAHRCFMFNEDFLRIGETQWMEAVSTLIQCVNTGKWPLYDASIAVLKPPRWASSDFLEEEL